ncbi:T9SS type A sorting domain-containing protein [Candidatus Latescibacterota bacterium]
MTSVEENNQPEFSLLNNYPNPFNPSTTIHFTLAESGQIQLMVYSISGQLISILIDDWQESGIHTIEWAPKELSSGVYFVRLRQNRHIETIKILYMK